jgi:hypothetical protein
MPRQETIMKTPTPRPSSRVRTPGIQPGETITTILGHQAPKLPHERDESRSSQDGETDEVVKQAARDIQSGQRDTSMGPPMDDTYHRIVHDAPKRVPARRKAAPDK